ncbi:Pol I core factor CF [Mortierella sp. GBA35]|nr:Pol I core factor CF [Mortierella sp. GBA35]
MENTKRKRKKPPCRVCRSTRWRKNSLGHYVCESGHQLEGYQEEEGEFVEGAGGYERRQKVTKKKKVVESAFVSGKQGTTLVLRCAQFILQLQVQALVRELGFPLEMNAVVREYWMVYVSNLVEYDDDGANVSTQQSTAGEQADEDQDTTLNNDNGAEGEGSSEAHFKDKTQPATPIPDPLDTQQEFQNSESESSDDDSDNDDNGDNGDENDGDHDSDDDEVDMVDGHIMATDNTELDEPDQQTYTDPMQQRKRAKESQDGRISKRRRGVVTLRTGMDYRYLTMRSLIAILYIASQHLKIPVVMGDFQRWIMQYKVPYYNAIKCLPRHMARRLQNYHKAFLQPRNRNPEALRRVVMVLLQQFERVHHIDPVTSNTPRLIARFIHELMLPVECYTCALRFYHIAYHATTSAGLKIKLKNRSTLRDPDRAMAIVIFVAKLIFGLDGKDRGDVNQMSWTNCLPSEKEWMTSLNSFDALRSQSEIPGMFGEFEELINVNPDIYNEHMGKGLRLAETEERFQLMSIFDKTTFKATGSGKYSRTSVNGEFRSQQSSEGQPPGIAPFIQRLYYNVNPPDDSMIGDHTPIPPGAGFVHYKGDVGGQFLGKYERLLSYASNILCINPEELQSEVCFIERILLIEKTR